MHRIIIHFEHCINRKSITNCEVIRVVSEVGFQLLKDDFRNMCFVNNEHDSIYDRLIVNDINFMTGKELLIKNNL